MMAKLYVCLTKKEKFNKIIHAHTHTLHMGAGINNEQKKVAEGVALSGQIGWESLQQNRLVSQRDNCRLRVGDYNLHINETLTASQTICCPV